MMFTAAGTLLLIFFGNHIAYSLLITDLLILYIQSSLKALQHMIWDHKQELKKKNAVITFNP